MVKRIKTMEQAAAALANRAGGQPEEQERFYTQEEVERIVEERLADARAEFERQLAEAGGGAEQPAQANGFPCPEYGAEDAQLREQSLAERESEIARRELRADAVETLASRGLPGEFAQLLDYSGADACAASIDTLEKVFRGAVQRGVDERIHLSRAKLPHPGGSAQTAMFDRMRSAAGLNN